MMTTSNDYDNMEIRRIVDIDISSRNQLTRTHPRTKTYKFTHRSKVKSQCRSIYVNRERVRCAYPTTDAVFINRFIFLFSSSFLPYTLNLHLLMTIISPNRRYFERTLPLKMRTYAISITWLVTFLLLRYRI